MLGLLLIGPGPQIAYMVLEQVIQTVVIPGQLVGHEDEQAEGEVHAELHRYDLCR